MTCIAAVVKNGVTYLGCDSFRGTIYAKGVATEPKLFHPQNIPHIVIGYTGPVRSSQVLKYSNIFNGINVYDDVFLEDPMPALVSVFVPNLQNLFELHGSQMVTSEQQKRQDGMFVVAVKDKIYCIEADYAIIESHNSYMACGSGRSHAEGSLSSTRHLTKDPERQILMALESSTEFVTTVAPPFYLCNTKSLTYKATDNRIAKNTKKSKPK